MSATTIVGPIGVANIIENKKPTTVQVIDVMTEQIITERKLLKTRMDESAGKMISADTSSEPTRFMASTMTTAIITAMRKLYRFCLGAGGNGKILVERDGENSVVEHDEKRHYEQRQNYARPHFGRL